MMDNSGRSAASVIMWLSYLGMVWFSIDSLGAWAILLAFVLMMPLMGAMGMMWSMGGKSERREAKKTARKQEAEEKRKRERIDNVLRDLSSEDLKRLKQRLEDGVIDEEVLYNQMVGDDGELLDGY